ncbi:lysoplasmalogenase [Arenibacter sp. 6A1]|uniref:lysoplasmalogenase n=1 Tax=Arenibacter sp. 6A1 TaxID=2720391 RepID=UPI001448699F|nr:lysoplasmalogenase [Arenibacter sp. 6A1]NKI26890.1 lysoplasmalogenase [Arenibacter sp. 6A1]
MKLKPIPFLWFFLLLVFLDLWIGMSDVSGFRQLTKPLILIALLLYFGRLGKTLPKSIYKPTLLALLFSLLGDIFLLYDTQYELFFILGLGSFFMAHLCYALVFLKQRSPQFPYGFWYVLSLLIAYGSTLYLLLAEKLGPLKIPVILYILGILTMAITAFARKKEASTRPYTLVFTGAVFFIISDSILAVNKFLTAVPWSHLLVMGTYAMAQYLIVMGLLGSKAAPSATSKVTI